MMPRPWLAWGACEGLLLISALSGSACGTSSATRSAPSAAGTSAVAGSPSSAGEGGRGALVTGAGGAGGAHAVGGGGSGGATAAGAANTGGGGEPSAGGSGAGGVVGASAGGAQNDCDRPGLVWKTANKTNYTSYPEPGSDECVKFSGCMYEGLFAACDQKRSLDWVKSHNIVAAFPDLKTLELHDLCLKSGKKTIVVTVYDTCGDSDCDNCCTQNKGDKDELIDIESFTDARWGVPDGAIEWADLGPTQGSGCD
ncbi:MAG TPA: hypothetical protein VFK05_30270 [Polyangiaceae bacterium]|nr:hypothetical protein [Polyangiaceae bacterium]